MYTLLDTLRALRRFDVGPEEIMVSEEIHRYILRQARALVSEERWEEDDEGDDEPH
jgi:hypothetical protein